MQNRPDYSHYLDEMFYNAIVTHDMVMFNTLLPLLQQNHIGSSLTSRDVYGNNFFTHAVAAGNINAVKILINMQALAEIISINTLGNTPLHLAATSEKDHAVPILLLLLDRIGREKNCIDIINRTNRKGQTAFHVATKLFAKTHHPNNFALMNILVNAGADIGLVDNQMRPPRLGFHLFSDPQRALLLQWWGERENKKPHAKISLYKHMQADRKTLSELVFLVNYRLNNLIKMKEASDVALVTSAAKVFILILFWLANVCRMLTRPSGPNYFMSSALMMMVHFTFFIFSSFAILVNFRTFDQERILPVTHWPLLKKRIKLGVLEKLNFLIQQEETSQTTLSPVPADTLVKLKNQIKFLNIATPIDEAIQNFRELAKTLDNIQEEMNMSQLPISFFSKEDDALSSKLIQVENRQHYRQYNE